MDKSRAPSPKALIFPFAITFTLGLAFFLTAGTLAYWQGWAYLSIFFCLTLFMVLYLSNRSPELLDRRADVKEEQPSTKSPAVLNLFLLIYIVPGFDFRFGLSGVPAKVVVVADFFVLLGYVLIILVFRENSYASSVVKLEEGQSLVSTGPYQVVRHPMYAGMLVMTLFTPLALGSYWAYIPCAFFVPWLLLRIKTEEETLLSGLAGYREYYDQTRYRLIPGVW